MPDWRDEICGALDFWIGAQGGASRTGRLARVGVARQLTERGWYAIDLRGSNANPDQFESFRLSGEGGPADGPSYPVMEAVHDGSLLRVRVAEFVNLADAYLWQNKQPATHLLVKLREGIAGLADDGLAHELAAGRLASPPKVLRPVAGFTPMQQEAYESCLAAGLRLVWGPPGTGKTRVISEAIGTLLTTGLRVLLVSATNIAVDNALLGVISSRRHDPGELLRVGPPHHPDVLKHPDVCLPHLVRQQLAAVEQQRLAIEAQLLGMRETDDELARLQEAVAGFDPATYRQAMQLLAAEAAIPGLAEAAVHAAAAARDHQRDAGLRREELTAAESRAQDVAATRSAYAEIDQTRNELAEVITAADDLNVRALIAGHAADQINADLHRRESGTFLAQMRKYHQIKRLRNALRAARQQAGELERRARNASELLTRRRPAAAERAEQLLATTECSRADIGAIDAALTMTRQAYAQAETIARQAEDQLIGRQQALHSAAAAPKPTEAQRALVASADRQQLPALAARVAGIQSKVTATEPERDRLEQEHAKVHERFERLRKDAEGEIILNARVVATTLARLRTSKALMDGPYDVVLVDEVGAANLPEVLLAVSRARRTAVLLGDFLQLRAITSKEVDQADRPDIQRWLGRDVFGHCGITSAQGAQSHQGCTVLSIQHRFGPEIMRLANAIAYDGVLTGDPSLRPHIADDPEIVLIDVDGLGEIARVRPSGPRSGWWPAGALLSRVLADYHRARGESTGAITPYRDQVDATLEALRDQEDATAPATEVGTAHRFQGREFPVVIFDLVEDEYDRRWMARASSRGSKWERDGTRLFTVAVTRAQIRLYLIGSRKQIEAAPDGTPFAQIAMMLRTRRARAVPATRLIAPSVVTEPGSPPLGPFSSELADVLAQHVRVADIHDERSFYEVFAGHLSSARRSIWIWAPWTATRVRSLLPVLADAVDRGVHVTLFVRDRSDTLQGKRQFQQLLTELRAILPTVVEINMMHQKIVIIDEATVLLGSLNTLSQNWTREVMLTMRGAHFARKLLEHEHATDFAAPPRCGACNGSEIDLRRRRAGEWYWRCYASACPGQSPPGKGAWTQQVLGRTSSRKSSA